MPSAKDKLLRQVRESKFYQWFRHWIHWSVLKVEWDAKGICTGKIMFHHWDEKAHSFADLDQSLKNTQSFRIDMKQFRQE